MIEKFVHDLTFAFRSFRRSPRFAFSAVAAIAVAVGAATAVFSVVDRNLFRPLPYPFEHRLVSVGIVAPVISAQDWLFAGLYQDWKSSQSTFEAVTAWQGVRDCDRNDGTPERLGCAHVEASFLRTLGVVPAIGRDFNPEEDQPGTEPVALISHALWTSRFGGESGVLDRRITIDGLPARIIGVLPPNFETPTLARADLLVPLKLVKGAQRQRIVHVIGRLSESLSVKSAAAQLGPLFQDFTQSAPADFRRAVPMQLRVETLRDHQTRGYQIALWTLLGAVLCFVLIACANVAHLLLARTATRRHEFAIRASLGASNWRLVRQTLTESTVLGVVGGCTGCLLALGLLRVFQALAPEGALRMSQASLDLRVLAFSMLLSLAAAFLFGLAPAVERLRGESLGAVRIAGRGKSWMRPALVSLQLSISVVLLTGTGLFLLSLWRLQQTRLGFTTEAVVTASFVLPEQRYAAGDRQIAFFNDLERKLEEIPGVVAAAVSDSLPPGGDPRSRPFVALIGGGNSQEKGLEGLVKWRYVTPGYFNALTIPIRRGRAFSHEDRAAGSQAIILSESLARRLYGKADPVGKTLRLEEPFEIIGVAADVRNAGLQGAADPEFYVVRRHAPSNVWRNQRPPFGWRRATAVVRTTLTDGVALDAVQRAIHGIDSNIAIVSAPLDSQVRQYFERPRFQTALFSLFALVGLALAAVGLYGLTSFLAVERTREVGVRIALGATPGNIAALMMREGITWTAIGVVVGLLMSMGVMQSIRAVLFEVEPLDIRVFSAAIALLAAVALAGIWIPSARASRIDPMEALRQE